MTISLIVAMDKNMGIGYKNTLPWNISEDMRFFREKTVGNGNNAVIMGRKTHESIGMFLSKRTNIILTRNYDYFSPIQKTSTNSIQPIIVQTVDKCITLSNNYENTWIIGGSEIYDLFLPYVDDIYISQIDKGFLCDTHFMLSFEDNFTLIEETNKIVREKRTQNDCEIVFKYYKRI